MRVVLYFIKIEAKENEKKKVRNNLKSRVETPRDNIVNSRRREVPRFNMRVEKAKREPLIILRLRSFREKCNVSGKYFPEIHFLGK